MMISWIDLGGVAVASLVVSRFRLDGGSMFGQVPKVLWSRFAQADEQNRIPLVVRALLIRTPAQLILVDAGMGIEYARREIEQLAIDPELGDLQTVLRAGGIDPAAVTDVVLSHLHFDHVAGLGRPGSAGRRRALPAARIHVQRAQWERAHDPGPKERRSFREEDLELLRRYPLELVDGEAEPWPGIRLRRSDGHTDGQQWVQIAGARQAVYYPADLIPTLAHIRAAYTMGFDLRPEAVIEERERLLGEAVAQDAILVFEHDPRTAAARVGRGSEGFVVTRREAGWA